MSDADDERLAAVEELASMWREAARLRELEGRHVAAQLLRRCAGEVEMALEGFDSASAFAASRERERRRERDDE